MYVHVCLLMYMQLPGDGKSPYQEYYIYGPFGGGGREGVQTTFMFHIET